MGQVIYMKNKVTNEIKTIEKGFNLWVFFFGWIYLFIKGDYRNAIILLVAYAGSLVLFGIENITLVSVILLIGNIVVAWNWHTEYCKILEKKDFEIINETIAN